MPIAARPKFHLIIAWLLLATLSILITGYGSWINNHAMQMPLVDILRNPALYPHDAFVSTLKNYPVTLWRVVAWLGRFIRMDYILFTGFVATRLLLIAAGGILAWTMIPGSRNAALSAMIFMAMGLRPIIGAGTIMPEYFEQTGLAMAVYLLAMSAFFARRRFAWAVLLVCGLYLNIMYGIFFSVYLAFFVIIDCSFLRQWRRWLMPAGIVFLCVLPLAIYTLRAMRPEAYDLDAWLAVNLIRAPHHMDPLAWRFDQWLRLGLLALLCLLVAILNRRHYPFIFRVVLSSSISCLFWLGLSLIARFSRSPSMLTLHAARGTDMFYCLCGGATAALFGTIAEKQLKTRVGICLMPIVLALFFMPWTSHHLGLLIAVLAGMAAAFLWRADLKFRHLVLLPLAVVLAWAVIQTDARHWSIRSRHHTEILAAAQWARENSAVDSEFLINPNWDEFRALAQRSVYVTWKDGGALPWSRSFARLWLDRFNSIGIDLRASNGKKHELNKKISREYEMLNDAAIARIADREPIDYWITSRDHQTAFPMVFEFKGIKIVRIKKRGRSFGVSSFTGCGFQPLSVLSDKDSGIPLVLNRIEHE